MTTYRSTDLNTAGHHLTGLTVEEDSNNFITSSLIVAASPSEAFLISISNICLVPVVVVKCSSL